MASNDTERVDLPAFLACAADARLPTRANARVRQGDQNAAVLGFIGFWQDRNGRLPRELVRDFRPTPHATPARIAAVPMKIDPDLQLALMASGLYWLLAGRVGNGKQAAQSQTLFRDFPGLRQSADRHHKRKRYHRRPERAGTNTPFLLNASCDETDNTGP